jgi:hypothetical protein
MNLARERDIRHEKCAAREQRPILESTNRLADVAHDVVGRPGAVPPLICSAPALTAVTMF